MVHVALSGPARVLIAGPAEGCAGQIAAAFPAEDYLVSRTVTGRATLERATDLQPDAILIDSLLPDMAGTDVCCALLGEHRVAVTTPILLLTAAPPSDRERLEAIVCGVRECVGPWTDRPTLRRLVDAYRRAKRQMDMGLSRSLVDPGTGLYNQHGLLRRAHELGAHAARGREALACLVVAVDSDLPDGDPAARALVRCCGQAMRSSGRLCDAVGVQRTNEVAMVAPATSAAGAVQLARRTAEIIESTVATLGLSAPGVRLSAGYDAVSNVGYQPVDPVTLLLRATAALHSGTAESAARWIRRL